MQANRQQRQKGKAAVPTAEEVERGSRFHRHDSS
jgi:hypothetical protein